MSAGLNGLSGLTGLWERHALPRVVDLICSSGALHRRRTLVCAGLEGRVLEVGFGSGHNLQHYPAAVTEILAVEPNDVAWNLAQERIRQVPIPVLRSDLDGQRLSEADASVDHVLATFSLCTIPDLGQALGEMHRVLRPGGEVHFLEHGLAPDPGVRRWQRRLDPVQNRLGGGCHLTRRPDQALETAGFDLTDLDTGYLPGPAVAASLFKPSSYLFLGRARKAG